jgi:hypothetical protein
MLTVLNANCAIARSHYPPMGCNERERKGKMQSSGNNKSSPKKSSLKLYPTQRFFQHSI